MWVGAAPVQDMLLLISTIQMPRPCQLIITIPAAVVGVRSRPFTENHRVSTLGRVLRVLVTVNNNNNHPTQLSV